MGSHAYLGDDLDAVFASEKVECGEGRRLREREFFEISEAQRTTTLRSVFESSGYE